MNQILIGVFIYPHVVCIARTVFKMNHVAAAIRVYCDAGVAHTIEFDLPHHAVLDPIEFSPDVREILAEYGAPHTSIVATVHGV